MKIFKISFLLFIFTANFLFSIELLKIDDYLKIIESELPDINKVDILFEKAKNNVDLSYSQFDVNLSSSFAAIGISTNDSFDLALQLETRPDYISGFTGNAGISTKLLSGTKINILGNYTQTFIAGENENIKNSKIIEYNNISYSQGLNITISQPLINNWFGFIDRYGIRNAKNNLRIETIKKEINLKSKLNYYEKLYLKWIETIKLNNLLTKTVSNAQAFEEQTKEKFTLGLVEEDGYQNARYSLLNFQEKYRATLFNYEMIKNELALFIDLDKYTPDIETINALYDALYDKEYQFIPFTNTRNASILNINKENLEALKKVKANQALPQLDIFGRADVKFNTIDTDIDGIKDRTIADPAVDFQVGLQLNYPLGGINSRAAKKEVQLLINLLLKEFDITENNYKKDLNNLISAQNYYKDAISYKLQSIDSLKKRELTEDKKFKQGRVTLRELIDTRNTIINTEISVIQTKTSIITTNIDYNFLTK